MIISFKHKFIFIAVPKTAGHSIRDALRPHLAPNDWEQCGLFEKKSFPQPHIAALGHGHLTWRDAKALMPEAIFSQFRSFAVIRDPYDRFVSACIFIRRGNPIPVGQETETMKRMLEDDKLMRHFLFRPQHEYLTNDEGDLVVDQLCRLDNLQHDFNQVLQSFGLPDYDLKTINAMDRDAADRYYDDDLRQSVRERYARDFDLLGFSK